MSKTHKNASICYLKMVLTLLVVNVSNSLQQQQSQCMINKNIQILNNVMPAHQLNVDDGLQHEVQMIAGEQIRYFFTINKTTSLKIQFLTCSSQFRRQLFYNQTVNLTKFTTAPASLSSTALLCAPNGRYDLIIESKEECKIKFKIILPTDRRNQLNYSHMIDNDQLNSSMLRYQNRIKRQQLVLKWDKSKLDIHLMNYCIAINPHRNHKSLCEAFDAAVTIKKDLCTKLKLIGRLQMNFTEKILNINPSSITIACTGRKNRQTLRGLVANRNYFIDIFGVHPNSGPFLLKSTNVWFNRTLPHVLTNGLLLTAKLLDFGRQSVFNYKVPKSEHDKSLTLQVIPCSSAIKIKTIYHQSNSASSTSISNSLEPKSVNIYKATVVRFNVSVADRLVVKISIADKYDNSGPRKFGILLSMDDEFMLPLLPRNTSVMELTSLSTCRSTHIVWYGSPDVRNVRYCILVFQSENRNGIHRERYVSSVCEPESTLINHTHFRQMHCIMPNRSNEIQQFKLLHLSPGSSYLVYILLKVHNTSLPYDVVQINMKSYCLASDLQADY